MADLEALESEIKELIVESLDLEDVTPEGIESEGALFGGGLDLDSIDALELGMALSKKYGVKVDNNTPDYRRHFASVRSLASFIASNRESTDQK